MNNSVRAALDLAVKNQDQFMNVAIVVIDKMGNAQLFSSEMPMDRACLLAAFHQGSIFSRMQGRRIEEIQLSPDQPVS